MVIAMKMMANQKWLIKTSKFSDFFDVESHPAHFSRLI